MRRPVASFVVMAIIGIAHAQQKPTAPTKNLACSETEQASGFTECEELRLQVSLSQLQELERMKQPIQDKAQRFIDAVVAEHPGTQYVTAQMQVGLQAQQKFAQQFPYGAIRPIPKPEPPAKPADAKPAAQSPTPAPPQPVKTAPPTAPAK